MQAKNIYILYTLILAILLSWIFIVPILAFENDMSFSYSIFSYTCHQKISRSLCFYRTFSIDDCTNQSGVYIPNDRKEITSEKNGILGYKIPVCARDIGLYLGMFISAIAYPFIWKLDKQKIYPSIFLVLAIVPLGLDGTIQLISELHILPFIYESTNLIRLITGLIAGLVASIYAIPILIGIFEKKIEQTKKESN